MRNAARHYLLISESFPSDTTRVGGRWRFVLELIGGTEKMVVTDSEPDIEGERLQLLTVIRGLEALDQPSRVTLLTPSRYVTRGIRRGLPFWRENGWQWEKFGQMSSIDNADLWQRLDRALEFHSVAFRNLGVTPDAPTGVNQFRSELTRRETGETSRNQSKLTAGDRFLPLRNWFRNWTRTLSVVPNIIL